MLLRDAPRQVQGQAQEERGSGRDGGVGRPIRRSPRRRRSILASLLAPPLAHLLALLLPPTLVVASLAEASGSPEDVAVFYEEGRMAIEEGDFEGASESFLAAYEAIPREELERRAALLFELVEARVAAFSEDGRPSHLCDATEILGSYLDDHTELRGAARSRDARKAEALRETYLDELDLLRSDNPDNPNLNCEDADLPSTAEDVPASEPELQSAPRTPREPTQLVRLDDRVIASSIACIGVGALLLGSATVGLGVGAHAEAEGEWLLLSRPELASDSPEASRLDQVGRQANLLAIIGGTTGALALGSGIALYVLGKRRQARSAPTLSFTPSLSPNRLGGGLGGRVRVRF